MLLLDECGQLSSQQLSIMDIVLRHLRENDMPFGGLLIFGSFDHKQLGTIDGLPFLLNQHIVSDFTVVKLEKSVRAAEDAILQVSIGFYCGMSLSSQFMSLCFVLGDSMYYQRESLFTYEQQGKV